MKKLYLIALFASAISAQTPAAPAAETAPGTVIATIDGIRLTYGELQSYMSTLPEAQAQTAMQNLANTVKQYALLNRLSKLGEEQKLDQKKPYIDILRAERIQVLAQATLSEQYAQTVVLPAEQEKYYQDHKQKQYTTVKVKAIYIAFASDPKPSGKKSRTEAEARDLATNIAAKIRTGADFVTLVKQYSEDDQSKKSDGDFGSISPGDNLPGDYKNAVLALKVGQITDPMRRAGGFYIFKADSTVDRAFSEVQAEIYSTLRETKMHQWMDQLQQSIPVKIEPGALAPPKPVAPPAGQ